MDTELRKASDGSPGSADVLVGTAGKAAVEERNALMCAPDSPEWHWRGYLPHRDRIDLVQSITFRLADSLPQSKLKQLEEDLALMQERERESERRRRIEEWLDRGMGCCALGHPKVANCVQQSLLHFHGERYDLVAWCIMPNHVHALMEPFAPMSKIVQGWKSYTARWILSRNESLGLRIPERNRLWLREYWDRYIRDANHFEKAIRYIHLNPVKAGLCREAEGWPWSSASIAEGNSCE